MSTSAARHRQRHGQRSAAGHIMVQIEIDDVAVPDMLVGAGLLDELHRDDRLKIAAGIERLIELLIVVEDG